MTRAYVTLMRNLKVFCRRHCGILLFVGMELWTGTFLKTLRKPGKASPQDGCEFPHPVAFEQEYDANLFHEAVPEILSDVRELRVFPCEDDVVAVHAVETGGRVVSERQCVSQELSCFGISQAVLHLDTLHGISLDAERMGMQAELVVHAIDPELFVPASYSVYQGYGYQHPGCNGSGYFHKVLCELYVHFPDRRSVNPLRRIPVEYRLFQVMGKVPEAGVLVHREQVVIATSFCVLPGVVKCVGYAVGAVPVVLCLLVVDEPVLPAPVGRRVLPYQHFVNAVDECADVFGKKLFFGEVGGYNC